MHLFLVVLLPDELICTICLLKLVNFLKLDRTAVHQSQYHY